MAQPGSLLIDFIIFYTKLQTILPPRHANIFPNLSYNLYFTDYGYTTLY